MHGYRHAALEIAGFHLGHSPGKAAPNGFVVIDVHRQRAIFLRDLDLKNLAQTRAVWRRAAGTSHRFAIGRLTHHNTKITIFRAGERSPHSVSSIREELGFEWANSLRNDNILLNAEAVFCPGIFAITDDCQLLWAERQFVA